MTEADDVVAAWSALPRGTFEARYFGRRWVVTRSVFAGGLSEKLAGEAADGSDRISANLYRLTGGARLYPCEMEADKVRAFVLGVVPDREGHGDGS